MDQAKKGKLLVPAIAVSVLLISYFYPRILLKIIGDIGSPWMSYFYLYGLGLVTFLIGLLLVIKTGSLKPGRGDDTYWLKWIIAGFIMFASGHAAWICFALNMPVKGGM